MRIRFVSLEDILTAGLPLDTPPNPVKTSRLTRSTGLEDMIYSLNEQIRKINKGKPQRRW